MKFKVGMEASNQNRRRRRLLFKAAEKSSSDDAPTPSAKVNTANAIKAPLPGVITEIKVSVGDEINAGDHGRCTRSYENG